MNEIICNYCKETIICNFLEDTVTCEKCKTNYQLDWDLNILDDGSENYYIATFCQTQN